MKIIVLALVVVLMSITAYADNIFYDKELKTLLAVEANQDQAEAWIRDSDGNEAQVYIGDIIGIEEGTVVEIDDASVTVQVDDTRMKMLVIEDLLKTWRKE